MTEGNSSYTPPALTVDIVLPIGDGPLAPVIPDIILCHPDGDTTGGGTAANYASVSIAATIPYSASGSVVTSRPSRLGLDLVANIPITGNASFLVERYVTDHTIAATATVTATASGNVTYDSNIIFVSAREISDSIQQSQHASFYKKGSFENNKIISKKQDIKLSLSLLRSASWFFNFEANKHLSVESNFYFEPSLLVGKHKGMLAEYEPFISASKQLRNEDASLITLNNKLLFEAMIARRTKITFVSEYGKLNSRTWHSLSEYNIFTTKVFGIRSEFAKLPSWLKTYTPPSLRRHIILERQDTALSEQPFEVMLCAPEAGSSGRTNINISMKVKSISAALLLKVLQNEHDVSDGGKGVLFVTNKVSLFRPDTGDEIKMLGFTVGIDSNSYAWSFSASLPLSELSKVDTAHNQRINLEFKCNGYKWRFILDGCEDSIAFGEKTLSIKGKSRAVLLAHPYAAQRGFKYDTPMSARQIAEDELNRNGVPSGFTLDWQLAGVNGWQIPANTYSYTGKTPINSLQWIAEAAGGFINADMSQDIIHVLAHYQIPSWEWAAQTPSINLTQSVITSRSRGRSNKPSYNGVLLYGENDNGIGALVKRRGTSGGYQPPMITSDLMTDTDASISRGKMVLSDTGDIGNIGISMPLIADIGVLKPSTLIGVNDGESWVGMVRGTTITGRLSSNKALEIDQSIDVERHFDKEIANG